MQNFKVGDKVKALIGYELEDGVIDLGDELTISKASDYFLCFLEHTGSFKKENFQLIPSKEKSIEDVEVGDIVYGDAVTNGKVVETMPKIFALDYGDGVVWWTFETAKKYGLKVKQPEKKKKEAYFAVNRYSVDGELLEIDMRTDTKDFCDKCGK